MKRYRFAWRDADGDPMYAVASGVDVEHALADLRKGLAAIVEAGTDPRLSVWNGIPYNDQPAEVVECMGG